MKTITLNRQGDLGFVEIDKLPNGLKEVKFNKEFTLALGKSTGHSHRVISKSETDLKIYQDNQGRYYLDVRKGNAVIEHNVHKPHTYGVGYFVEDIQREYDELEEYRKVVD